MNVTIVQNLKPEFAQVLHQALAEQYGNVFIIQAFQPKPGRVGIALNADASTYTYADKVERMAAFAAGFAVGWAQGAAAVQTMLLQEAARG